MNGTIVYERAEANVEVTPTPLVAVIRGGIQRYFYHNETVLVSGQLSYDPDFPGVTDFRSVRGQVVTNVQSKFKDGKVVACTNGPVRD